MEKVTYKTKYIKYEVNGGYIPLIREKGIFTHGIENPLNCFTIQGLLDDIENGYIKVLEVKNIKRDLKETEILNALEITIDSVEPSSVSALCEVVADVLTLTGTIKGYDPKDPENVKNNDIMKDEKAVKYYNQKALNYTIKGRF